ncbi:MULTISPECIES: hypothetical protein [Pseudoalteromonas]|uniref:Uncharacterized protein n=1 Tax=Pseudoalteromonas obscura TaxID=3048491 RepID=A0ABT7ENZ6_9GAMM|nr:MULTISPECIES: hypothetical protein [Pseudoalteromonas]MBQ4838095.1 hypothetical protein [Pseudoalteromonas luteoviolacea]MDK2596733.1 hypothetical protein [Pseudoalteromonas sp. P94(2023)]
MKKIALFAFLALSFNASAAWSGLKEIHTIKAQSNGVYVQLKSFTNTDNSVQCTYNNGFFLEFKSAEEYQTRVSMLLAAYMAGKPVNISYNSCALGYLSVGSVSLN